MAERRVVKGWVVERRDDGSLVPIAPVDQPQMPANPTFPLQAPKMQGDIANTAASTNRTVVQTQGDRISQQKTLAEIEAERRKRNQNPIGDRDQAFINEMRQGQGDLPSVLRDITAAQAAVDRFQPAPGRGSDYAWGVPEDNDWPTTVVAKNAYAGLRGMPQQSKEDYQTLSALQNAQVLNAQLAQKGPQTESDAIRMKLANVSPNKDVRPNARILAEQQYDTMMKMQRAGFYENWANRLGSTHALNRQGKNADQVWNEVYQQGLTQMRNDPRFQRGTGISSAPRKPAPSKGWGRVEVSD